MINLLLALTVSIPWMRTLLSIGQACFLGVLLTNFSSPRWLRWGLPAVVLLLWKFGLTQTLAPSFDLARWSLLASLMLAVALMGLVIQSAQGRFRRSRWTLATGLYEMAGLSLLLAAFAAALRPAPILQEVSPPTLSQLSRFVPLFTLAILAPVAWSERSTHTTQILLVGNFILSIVMCLVVAGSRNWPSGHLMQVFFLNVTIVICSRLLLSPHGRSQWFYREADAAEGIVAEQRADAPAAN
ncbi:hypothetical protein GCM10023155_47100 [Bremerella cremea]